MTSLPNMIVESQAQSEAPRDTERDFVRFALDSAAIVAITDTRGTITFVNKKFCEISGYSEAELLGSNHRMLKSGFHDAGFFRQMYRTVAHGKVWHGEICNRRKDGSIYWVDTTIVPHMAASGKADSYTSIRFDITPLKNAKEDLRESQAHLEKIVNIDPLTSLPNRRRFHSYIEELVSRCEREGTGFHLGVLDLDSFKDVNDSLGHDAGDQLLQIVARRLEAFTGRHERFFIARLGGDEFGLILSGMEDAQAQEMFEAVLESLREPVRLNTTLRRCSASLGLAAFPHDARDPETLFKLADIALYHAKALGRDRSEIYQAALKEQIDRRAAILSQIESALQQRQFRLHYQPVVPDLPGTSLSFEALMRWHHPRLGVLSPAYFMPGFEDPAMRAAFGMFTLDRVFEDMQTMRAQDVPFRKVAINMTGADLRSDAFIDRFHQRMEETGIGPAHFCMEVTEGMFLGQDQTRVYQGLERFHAAGVEIALDDFGTGFASLTHLRRLPFDRLKIDRSFIANMVESKEDQAIVHGIIDIAHSLGKVVTAEGVETAEQVALLRAMGCDDFQGWYFSKALDVAALADAIPRLVAFSGGESRQALRRCAS